MEAYDVLNMVEDEFRHRCIIYVIISDDENTMQAVIKHPPRGA